MSTIDNRIVDMDFDNADFEKGVGDSLKTLANLKKGLNLDGAVKSLSGLSDAAKNFSLSSIAQGVEHIAGKFTAMSVIGITALVNLANAAYTYGANIVKSLTVAPISMGFEDYNSKLTSIQTITNATGKTVADVNTYFGELDTYADKTIYNLKDMTGALAKFTNAGVDLDKSVPAIKGIANMVALAGQDAGAATIAFYNMSQSIAGGFLTTMDYRSLNLANVATKEWKTQMIEGAVAAGTLKKNSDGLYSIKGSEKAVTDQQLFTESLSEGWATTEVLLNVLGEYGDVSTDIGKKAQAAAQDVKSWSMMMETLKASVGTGWTDTFELLVGDLNEAKALFTPLTAFVQGFLDTMTNARNELLGGWVELGGREDLIETVKSAFKGLLSVITPISEALKEIFPPLTSEKLFAFTTGLKTLAERFKMGVEGAKNLKRTFKGVFALIDIGKMFILALAKGISRLILSLAPGANSFLNLTGNIGDFILKLRDSIKTTDFFNKAIGRIEEFLRPVIKAIRNFVDTIVEHFKAFKVDTKGIDSFMDGIKIRFEPLTKLAEFVGKVIGVIVGFAKKLTPTFFKLGSIIATGFGRLMEGIADSVANADFEKIFDFINSGLLAAILLAIKKFLDKGAGAFDGIKGILDGVKGSLTAWQTSLKADVLLKIAGALALLSASVLVLSMIDSKKLTTALTALTVMFVQLFSSMAIFEKMSLGTGVGTLPILALALIGISTAILILAGAVATLGRLDAKELIKGTFAIASLTAVVITTALSLAKVSPLIITSSIGLVIFSGALTTMVEAVKKLGELDQDDMTKGLIGIGVLLTELAIFLKVTDLGELGIINTVGITILAVALNVIALAVQKFADIDSEKLARGLVAVGVVLTELSLFVKLTGDGKDIITTSLGLTVLGVALVVIAEAMKRLGDMSSYEISKGLLAMAGALTIITTAMYAMPKDILLTGAGLLVVAGALVIMAEALVIMGDMTWDEVTKGLTAMAGAMTIFAVGLNAMTGGLPGAYAMIVAAGALAILAPPLKMLGSMSLAEIGLSLLALAGVFTILGVAASVLTPLLPSLVALAGAMFLLGLAGLAVGGGVLAFSTGLAALAVTGTAGAAALVLIISSIAGLLPMIGKQFGKALVNLIDVIGQGAPKLYKAVTAIALGIIGTYKEVIPEFIDMMLTLVLSLLKALEEKMPEIVDAGWGIVEGIYTGLNNNIGKITDLGISIITKFIDAVALKLPELIDSSHKLIIAYIDGMTASIEENMPALRESVNNLIIELIKGFIQGIFDNAAAIDEGMKEIGRIIIDGFKEALKIKSPSEVFVELGILTIQGFIDGIATLKTALVDKAKLLIQSALNAIREKLQAFKDTGRDLIIYLIEGISALRDSIVSKARSLIESALNALKEKWQEFKNTGRDLVLGFVEGIQDFIGNAVEAAANLAQSVLNAVQGVLLETSPSKALYRIGEYAVKGFANGISESGILAQTAITNVGDKTISGLSSVVSRISDALSTDIDMNPTIRPVIDLTEIVEGGKTIDSILNKKGINPLASTNRLTTLSTAMSNLKPVISTIPDTTKNSSISFTQNNYSPTALSRLEIYRQTKNQLLTLKGLA